MSKKKSKPEQDEKVALQAHSECKSFDLKKAYTIAQAFPSTVSGKRVSMLPEKLHCSLCRNYILGVSDDREFFVCKRCWEVGLKVAICGDCMEQRDGQARGSKGSDKDQKLASLLHPATAAKSGHVSFPDFPYMSFFPAKKRGFSAKTHYLKGDSSRPNSFSKAGASLEPPKIRVSQRSSRSLSSGRGGFG